MLSIVNFYPLPPPCDSVQCLEPGREHVGVHGHGGLPVEYGRLPQVDQLAAVALAEAGLERSVAR